MVLAVNQNLEAIRVLVAVELRRRWKIYSSDCFFFSFFGLHFFSARQSANNSNTVDVLGHKYILGPSQTAHFNP